MNSEENTLEILVEEGFSGLRADKFLGEVCTDLSRARLQKLISGGDVLLNNNVLASPSKKVNVGDRFLVQIPEAREAIPQAEDLPLGILYEDEDLIVLNKAAGMVVHPGAGNWTGTLVNALLAHCGDTLSGIGGVVRPGIVHRLDKDTTGLMVVAKNDLAHQSLSEQLKDRSLSRVYKALVLGVITPIKGVVDRPVGRHRHNRLKMSVMSNAPKVARTFYEVEENFSDSCSFVRCKLDSGRTHQIRVHMEALGNPLIGDPLYGPQPTAIKGRLKKAGYSLEIAEELVSFPRQALHAEMIEFVHPRSGDSMGFKAELPEDFSKLLKILDK